MPWTSSPPFPIDLQNDHSRPLSLFQFRTSENHCRNTITITTSCISFIAFPFLSFSLILHRRFHPPQILLVACRCCWWWSTAARGLPITQQSSIVKTGLHSNGYLYVIIFSLSNQLRLLFQCIPCCFFLIFKINHPTDIGTDWGYWWQRNNMII